MVTTQTAFRDVYENPVGKQTLNILLGRVGRSPELIGKVMVGYVNLGSIEFLLGKLPHGQGDALAEAVAALANRQPPPDEAEIIRVIEDIVPMYRRESI